MKAAFITDPIASFNPKNETTSFLAHEICRKYKSCYFVELKNLSLHNHNVMAHAHEVQIGFSQKTKTFSYEILKTSLLNLKEMDCVWLRKDPPFDMTFFDHLSILEFLKDKTLLINDPSAIKTFPEKIFPLVFQKMCPDTLISQNQKQIFDYVHKHKKVILKPLNLSGGRGIVIAESKNPSLNSLIDILTKNQNEYICAQKFIAKAKLGDKRVLIWNDQILGSFLRVPSQKDFRGNLHSGARFQKTKLTPTEEKSLALLMPFLKGHSLKFVGVDFLDSLVSEINITSPMGIGELNHLYSSQFEKIVVKNLETELGFS